MTVQQAQDEAFLREDDPGLRLFSDAAMLKRLWYFDGRLLTAADLRTEQKYLRNLAMLSNQSNGYGIVHGFDVKLAGDSLAISAGLAVCPDGRFVSMQLAAELDIAALIAPNSAFHATKGEETAATESGFGPCTTKTDDGKDGGATSAAAAFFVLSAAPVEAFCGEAESFGHPCTAACGAESDRSFVIEGVSFQVREYIPSPPILYGSPNQIRGAVASRWFALERSIRRNKMSRSLLNQDFWCEGTSAPLVSEVELAVFDRDRKATTSWVDEWTVRRELSDASPKNHWLNAADLRPWNVFVAQVLQFQCQLAHCVGRATASQYQQQLDIVHDKIAQAQTALKGTPDKSLEPDLKSCVGNELPPCGWLPMIGDLDACASTKRFMGNGVELDFYKVRPDYVGQVFHEAQHLDRISLSGDKSGRSNEVDILVPKDRFDAELDWVFFVRRRRRAELVCEVKTKVDTGSPTAAHYIAWLNTAPVEVLTQSPLNTRQAESLVKWRKAGKVIQSFGDLEQVPHIGPTTAGEVKEWAARQPFQDEPDPS